MGLSIIEEKELDNERISLNYLIECSKNYKSAVFNSGAGSGKTYALIECLKSIVGGERENLKEHNQKIACITYTNVAAEHIKKCLGTSDVVDVSTIHERIWNIVGNQKSALLKLHIDKLNEEIQNINSKLIRDADYKKYRELDNQYQTKLLDILCENANAYYKAYNLKAADFKAAMPQEIRVQFSDLLSNVLKFKGLVDKLFKRKRYLECLSKIEKGEKEYQVVKYDAMYNRDRLDKMRISHDTLLEYAYILFEKYPTMRQIMIDKYPYVLIDEYQDTAGLVVQLMNLVDSYAKEIKHDMFIAYFGDSVQNIYDAGVGKRLMQLHSDLTTISKQYNRRSYTEIVNVANKVRNDEIEQHSIYSDSNGGSVKFYSGTEEDIDEFINKCAKKWGAQMDNPLHCMFATNQLVAVYSGFTEVYDVFKGTEAYQGIGYKQLNSELLSQDIIRLGRIQAILYKIVKLYIDVRNEKTSLRNILIPQECRNMSLSDLQNTMKLLQEIDGDSLDEILICIFEKYESANDKVFRLLIDKMFDIDEELSYENVLRYILKSLYKSSDDTLETKVVIKNVLNIKTESLLNWFHYIQRDEKKDICYHTFHSTKGLEYENVAIILGKDFGLDRNIFANYFKNYGIMNNEISIQFEKARNILYVAVTRTIKNLRILYIDNCDEIRDGIEKVFDKIYSFEKDISSADF